MEKGLLLHFSHYIFEKNNLQTGVWIAPDYTCFIIVQQVGNLRVSLQDNVAELSQENINNKKRRNKYTV